MVSRPSRVRKFQRRANELVAGALALFGLGGCFAAPAYEGPTSDHFDGERFFNLQRTPPKTSADFWKWVFTRDAAKWPEWVDFEPTVPPQRVEGDALRVTFVNHATVLLQTHGLNILTDPVWSERTSPLSWAGPRRHTPPGIRFEDLPPIDVVLVSHNHYDHLDLETLKALAGAHGPRIYLPLGNNALLVEEGIPGGKDLDWWDEVELPRGMKLHLVPVHHWSGRGLSDRYKTLWGGFVLETPGGVIYFAGDTGWGPHFAEVAERFGPPRLALLPIGAYLPRWFMSSNHVSPAEAVLAHKVLGSRQSLAVHWGTFQLSDEGMTAPKEALYEALAKEGLPVEVFWALRPGAFREVPQAPEKGNAAVTADSPSDD